MAAPRLDRRLAAVLAADIVGYSRLMERDEQGTLDRLRAHRKELIEPLVAEQGGRVVKLMGDGVLCEFGSAVHAVRCAVLMQQGLAEREAGVADDEKIRLRIGINLGDVIHEEGDVYGDGVNLAARLEALAEPGGICMARNIHNQVKGKLPYRFEPMGRHRVKNIAEPVEVWRVAPGEVAAHRPTKRWWWHPTAAAAAAIFLLVVAGGLGGWWWYASRSPVRDPADAGGQLLPDKPSVAVLPFDNLSGDERLGRLTDGMVEDVITDLSRFRELFVIARNSTFVYKGKAVDVRQVGEELGVKYVLEGSVQSDGQRLRVTAQLVDAVSGNHVWSERYDRPLDELFAVQDEVTRKIAASLSGSYGALARAQRDTARRKPPRNLLAYDYYLLGVEQKHFFTRESNKKAQELFHRALELDPTFARAYIDLAYTYNIETDNGWGESWQQSMDNTREAARKALVLDPYDSRGYIILGTYYQYLNDFERALAEFDKAFELNPNDAEGLAPATIALVRLGQPERALEAIERFTRLDPRFPDWYYGQLRDAYFHNRRFEDAIAASMKRRHPNQDWDVQFRALGYAQLGRHEEAAREVAEFLRRRPDYSAEKWLGETGTYARDAELDLFLDSVKKAGLPLCATAEQLGKYPQMRRLQLCEDERLKVAAPKS